MSATTSSSKVTEKEEAKRSSKNKKDEREQREPIMEASDVSVASIEDPVSFVILWPLNFVHKECNILTLRFILSVSYVMNIRWIVF